MLKLRKILCLICFYTIVVPIFAEDSTFIKVHFLYGSKPKRKYKDTESKWFGGKKGGHVGIELDSNKIIDFNPSDNFHYWARKKNLHGKFIIHTDESFWEIFGHSSDSVKKLSVLIPISFDQKLKLDSIEKAYLKQTPYDYAFIGMRCGAAAYDILSQLNILKRYSYRKTYFKIFYPKKLRKRLLKKSRCNGWQIYRQEGTKRRKWEKD